MNQFMREESGFGTNGVDQQAALGQSTTKHSVKLCCGSHHAEKILRTLDWYRHKGIFTDVVLVADGQEFPCHRVTLSANSAYFRAMFSGELKGGTVNLQKLPAPSMSLALDYMYGGNVGIHEDNVEGLLELSSALQIPKLKAACAAFLGDQLCSGNCLALLRLASSFSMPSLAEKSQRLVQEGFVEVSQSKEYLELGAQELKSCLASDWLAVPKEEVVFVAVMRWVRHDPPARKGALGGLLELVRLPLLDPVYFLEKVETEELIQGTQECLPLLQEAHKYHILGMEASSLRSRPRRYMEVAEMIAVVGGCDKKGLMKLPFVDLFHPASRQWKPLPNLPGYTKSEFAVCTLKNDIYLSGGHIHSRDVWVLSSRLNIWIKVACLQKGRWRHRMATLYGKIYAVGGYDGVHRLASVECYDSFLNRWTALPPLPEAVQCYNPEEKKWCLLSPAPFSQRCIEAVTLDDLVYVAGGLLSQIFCYSPQRDTWTRAASLPGPLESCGVTACDGKIYILGGRDENAEGTDKVYALHAAMGQVELQPPLPRCTSYHGCVTVLRHKGW